MRKAFFTGLLFLIVTLPVSAEQAPDWRLAAGSGDSIRLSQAVEGQPVVLFFWATWCPYCKALMPHLQSMRLEYGEDIEIFAIQINDKHDAVAFIDDAGYDFTVFPQGDRIAELYGITGTPGVIVIDRELEMRFDLRALPRYEMPETEEKPGHSKKAAYKAPYWAAELRAALDAVLEED